MGANSRQATASPLGSEIPHHRYGADPGCAHVAKKRLDKRDWDPKRYGAVPGIPVGSIFQSRLDASQASIHAPPVTGIATGKVIGEKAACASICVSGGYVGDVDLGERLTFSGAGGRDLRGSPIPLIGRGDERSNA